MSTIATPAAPHAIPNYMKALACLTTLIIFAQFLMAGLSLFKNGAIWNCHTIAGFVLAAPIGLMLVASLVKRMQGLRWLLALQAVAYVVQVFLIIATRDGAGPIWQALHPFNGSLLLALSLMVLNKSWSGKAGWAHHSIPA